MKTCRQHYFGIFSNGNPCKVCGITGHIIEKAITLFLLFVTVFPQTVLAAFPTQSALFVSASSQSLTRADTASLSTTGTVLTLETYVYFVTLPSTSGGLGARILNKFHSDAGSARGNWELFVDASDKLSMIVSDDGTYNAGHYVYRVQDTASVTTNTWYHIKGIFDSGTITLYINGSVVASSEIGSGPITNVSDSGYEIGIGARNGNGTMVGFLDGRTSMTRVWHSVQSADNKCTVYGTSPPQAEWTHDNTLNDNSGNGNTLTNNNVVTFSANVPVCASAATFNPWQMFPF